VLHLTFFDLPPTTIFFRRKRMMAKSDVNAQLHAVDRWASKRRRAVEFLKESGVSGLVAKAREVGARGTAAFVARQARYMACSFLGKRWDLKYGVDTSGQIDLINVDVVGTNKTGGTAVVSTSPRSYAFLSAFFPANWAEYTFVDVGCGKGRVMLLAALQGFNRIIGIEFASVVAGLAEQNLARFSGRKPAEWRVINADATTIDLPLGAPLLIYCFNPFDAEIWERFIPVIRNAASQSKKYPICLVLCGTVPEILRGSAAVIDRSALFRERARGVTPFFMDAYSRYHYWIFDAK